MRAARATREQKDFQEQKSIWEREASRGIGKKKGLLYRTCRDDLKNNKMVKDGQRLPS